VDHEHRDIRSEQSPRRVALWVALLANTALLVVEAVGGFAFHSLSLLAGSVHLLTDVTGLAIALLALRLAVRPATPSHSFGLQRAEVLAAQANAAILLFASLWVLYEAIRRLLNPVHVDGLGLFAVASLGLVVNLGSALILRRTAGESLNMRGAFIHLASDAAGSAGAMLAGVLILIWDLHRADPTMAILITLLVLAAAWRLLRDTAHVLMEGTPSFLDPDEVERAITGLEDVASVHHLHLWSLASDVPALSAHVILARGPDVSMHDAQLVGDRVKDVLERRFGIRHATLELECHEHDDPADRGHQA
jgi:cobalt-zinc-cadmium efflux system protein